MHGGHTVLKYAYFYCLIRGSTFIITFLHFVLGAMTLCNFSVLRDRFTGIGRGGGREATGTSQPTVDVSLYELFAFSLVFLSIHWCGLF